MSLSSWLYARRKRNTIRRYITQLRPLLGRRYGQAEHYSPAQVYGVLRESGLPTGEAAYALVLYCTPEAFATDQAGGSTAGYWQLRTEILGFNFRHGREGGQGGGAWEGSMADYAAWFCSGSDTLP